MRNTAEIYVELQKLTDELLQLSQKGNIKMSTDSLNCYPNSTEAFREAYAALTKAIEITAWMETKTATPVTG